MKNSFQDIILIELQRFLHPLVMFGNTEDEIVTIFNQNGWDIKGVLGSDITSFISTISAVKNGVKTIQEIIENPPETVSEFIDALKHIPPIIEAVTSIAQTVDDLKTNGTGGAITGVDLSELQKIPLDLMNFLTIRYLFFNHIRVYRALELFGLIQYEKQEFLKDDNDKLIRGARIIPRLKFDKIGDLFSDPSAHFTNFYSLDFSDEQTTAEGGYKLFRNLAQLLITFGIKPDLLAADLIEPPTLDEEHQKKGSMTLSKEFFFFDDDSQTSTGLSFGALFRLLSDNEINGRGLRIEPFGDLDISTILGNWQLDLQSTVSPGTIDITSNGIYFDPLSSGGITDFRVALELIKLGDPELGNQALLIGSTTGTRFEIKEIAFGGLFEIKDVNDVDLEYGLNLRLGEAAFVIQGGDGDGFLAKVLPEEGLRIAFDMGLEWTNKKGFKFTFGINSGSALELVVPINQTLFNVVDFKDVRFRLAGEPGNKGISTAIGGSVGLNIGPFKAMIENMGVKATFSLPESGGGNLGPLDLDFGFKPPSGIAMSIDAGGFKGGGFLSIAPPRYVGALQLTFAGGFNISAVCIINTELPNSEEGFSLLVVMNVEFAPAIQIGMGIAITGFGGMLGLHRSINTSALRTGLKTGMLESILFPKDILGNPDKVISDLDSAFPIQKDHFVFGPMLKATWGDKSFVNISFGLMIELPNPKVLLPGLIEIGLFDTGADDDTVKVLDINIAFIGIIDIPSKMISIDSSIYDSKILMMAIEGDMAFRLTWGENPVFVLSMGGFHPAFTPPPLDLQNMNRLSIKILNDENIKLYAEAYMAITSNTFQFGAALVFYAKAGLFEVDCFFGLDTIFFFNPFQMEVGVQMRGQILWSGDPILSLIIAANLSGPSPWRIFGKVQIVIAELIDFEFKFDAKFGKKIPDTIPTISLRPILREELLNSANWMQVKEIGQNDLITLGKGPQDMLLIRPMGGLKISQNKVPLKFKMEKYGTDEISGADQFEITKVWFNDELSETTDVEDLFAPVEYQKIEDNTAAVEADAYEKYVSGIKVSSKMTVGTKRKRCLNHELILVDTILESNTVSVSPNNIDSTLPRIETGNVYSSEIMRMMELKNNAVAKSDLSVKSPSAKAIAKKGVQVFQKKYRIVNKTDLTPIDTVVYGYATAKNELKLLLKDDPSLVNLLQIVPVTNLKDVTTSAQPNLTLHS